MATTRPLCHEVKTSKYTLPMGPYAMRFTRQYIIKLSWKNKISNSFWVESPFFRTRVTRASFHWEGKCPSLIDWFTIYSNWLISTLEPSISLSCLIPSMPALCFSFIFFISLWSCFWETGLRSKVRWYCKWK